MDPRHTWPARLPHKSPKSTRALHIAQTAGVPLPCGAPRRTVREAGERPFGADSLIFPKPGAPDFSSERPTGAPSQVSRSFTALNHHSAKALGRRGPRVAPSGVGGVSRCGRFGVSASILCGGCIPSNGFISIGYQSRASCPITHGLERWLLYSIQDGSELSPERCPGRPKDMAINNLIKAMIVVGFVALSAWPASAGLQCPPFCVNVPVPEPGSFLLLAAGAGGLAWYLKKRR